MDCVRVADLVLIPARRASEGSRHAEPIPSLARRAGVARAQRKREAL
ncbi:MAG TPA: hypothetical protein VFF52_14250 [Isosphaeraceae bacterium]|nr:hypothetical protein [Isosphaeraceae bacterium]